ncbi:MAG: MFS transporter [Rectinemataceae bacterium]
MPLTSPRNAPPSRLGKLLSTWFPALGERNFRLFWLGQLVSLAGTWMQNLGQSWLVLELTGSPAKLGLVSALQFLPMMLFSLVAGPFVDRFPKRKLLIITQTMLMLLALALATLTATGLIRYWNLLVLACLLGFVNLLDMPTRQAFVIELSGRDKLMNAVSLNSAAFNLARVIGPAIAGLLIEGIGIAPCFFLNALSFVAVIAALLRIDAGKKAVGGRFTGIGGVLDSAREGLRYILARREIALPLGLLAVISTIVINYNIFIPTFARGPLGGGASGFGFLMTAIGLGSLVAALVLAAQSRKGPSMKQLYGGALVMCVAFVLLGLQRNWLLSAALLVVIGFSTISFTASTNALIQLSSDDAHRGRVMSVFSLVFGGVTPIGALYAGWFTDQAGPSLAISTSGAVGLLATILVIPLVRRAKRK